MALTSRFDLTMTSDCDPSGSALRASRARAAATNSAVEPTLVVMSQVSLSLRMRARVPADAGTVPTAKVARTDRDSRRAQARQENLQ